MTYWRCSACSERSDFQTFMEGGPCRACGGKLEEMKTLEDLQALVAQMFPGATVKANHRTWEVVIRTNRFLMNGDATNTLVSKEERDAPYKGKGKEYVIELPYTGFGREEGTFYFVEDGEDYTTDPKKAKRFSSRKEAQQVIEDAGNMMDEDEPRVRVAPSV